MRIEIIKILSNIDDTVNWSKRVNSYNKKHSLFIENNGNYLGTIDNLILYVENSRLKEEQKIKILYELYKSKNKQLKEELSKYPSKQKKSDIGEVFGAFDVINEQTTINNFLADLDEKKDNDIIGIFTILHKYYFYVLPYTTYNTMKSRFSKFRNAIREKNYSREKENLILNFFRLPCNVTDFIKKTYQDKINENNKDLSSLISVSIKQVKKLMNDLEKDIFSDKFDNFSRQQKIAKLYFYLHLGTGRRPTEICRSGTFSTIEKNQLSFNGQAKTKKREIKPYNIPCLFCENNKIVIALELFRKVGGRIVHNQSLHTTLHNWLIVGGWNELLQKINISQKSIVFYDLRSLYSLVCDKVLNDNMESRTYISHILGHIFEDTAKSYTKFKIIK
jgi:integrase